MLESGFQGKGRRVKYSQINTHSIVIHGPIIHLPSLPIAINIQTMYVVCCHMCDSLNLSSLLTPPQTSESSL